jgi:hypothetical protein
MRLYKYRDLSRNSDEEFGRLRSILQNQTFWCAKPVELNDPTEFIWECDYSPSGSTLEILAGVLSSSTRASAQQAMQRAAAAIEGRHLEPIAHPIFEAMMTQCRAEIGLACFGTSDDNNVLWERYGGSGAGVCIEAEAPGHLLNSHLYPVQYPTSKRLHVDQLLSSYKDRSSAKLVYEVALLSKPFGWAPEAEVRFVSTRQHVAFA